MNNASLSQEALSILNQIEAEGRLPTAASVFRAALPPKRWWTAVSRGSRRKEPYWEAAKRIASALDEDPTLPIWPLAMYEVSDFLPQISLSEAIALIDRFLQLESGGLVGGTSLYQLQWDVLAAHYCQLRERYQVLKTLVSNGVMVEAAASTPDRESGLRWPLTITECLFPLIRTGRLRARLPTLTRLEDFIAATLSTYPNLVKIILWIGVGGGLTLLLQTVWGWIALWVHNA